MNLAGRLDEYPLLKSCQSDLRTCSIDDSDSENPCYMFDEEGVYAFNLDQAMRMFCRDSSGDDAERSRLARSADALYVGKDLQNWDGTLALVEFKNGNLLERNPAVLSAKQRKRFKDALIEAVDGILVGHGSQIGWDDVKAITDEVEGAIQCGISDYFGNATVKTGVNSRTRHHSGGGYTLETVKNKALSSAFLLQQILGLSVCDIQKNVDFILVYNPDVNPSQDDDSYVPDEQFVPRIRAIDSVLPSLLARNAKRPLDRFGLRQSLGVFFHHVLTLTSEQLKQRLL